MQEGLRHLHSTNANATLASKQTKVRGELQNARALLWFNLRNPKIKFWFAANFRLN